MHLNTQVLIMPHTHVFHFSRPRRSTLACTARRSSPRITGVDNLIPRTQARAAICFFIAQNYIFNAVQFRAIFTMRTKSCSVCELWVKVSAAADKEQIHA